MATHYCIYGKEGKSKFMPLDLSSGEFVKNRIYMTIFNEDEQDKAKDIVKMLHKENPEYQFEVRRA